MLRRCLGHVYLVWWSLSVMFRCLGHVLVVSRSFVSGVLLMFGWCASYVLVVLHCPVYLLW